MRLVHGLHFNHLRGDICGGMVAALVALPLVLVFGVVLRPVAIAGFPEAIFAGFFVAVNAI